METRENPELSLRAQRSNPEPTLIGTAWIAASLRSSR
jgi:hypothetical protein